jgi:hypothetical protein
LKKAVGGDWKGKATSLLYLTGIALSFLSPPLGQLVYLAVALLWFIPDKRIEKTLESHQV